jgi:1-phosphofructokinase/tagatose 6-phosphate kinase
LISSLPFSPDVIKPNYAEFVQTFLSGEMSVAEIGEHSDDPGLLRKVREKMLDLRESHRCEVVLTRGAHDVLYTHKGGVSTYTPPKIRPINTIGSGDAFTAGLAATLHAGESLPAAVAKGVECAARNAELIRPGIIR